MLYEPNFFPFFVLVQGLHTLKFNIAELMSQTLIHKKHPAFVSIEMVRAKQQKKNVTQHQLQHRATAAAPAP